MNIFSSENNNLISRALTLIWKKSDKRVESCQFDKDKVKLSFKNNEGHIYFDLQDETIEKEVIN